MSGLDPAPGAPAPSGSYEQDLDEVNRCLQEDRLEDAARLSAGLPPRLPGWVEELRRDGLAEPRLRERSKQVESLLDLCRRRRDSLLTELISLRGRRKFLEQADGADEGNWVSGRA